ncbi:adenylate/guanylate cyclase domain-containing protein [Aquipuribacter sp. MA13-6]|uniref:adenylate/guanylate cyclase domain-containing protein n=1 Tax=unclassified Aquipuribacter TaxID=2635084 RepID=UPI003EEB3405
MSLKDELETSVNDLLAAEWNRQDATTVPATDGVVLKNGAKDVDATYVYADLAGSTKLAQSTKDWAAAKIIRVYLSTATRILKANGGEIRSFDGDRVMAIFIGASKNTAAAKAGLQINWAIDNLIQPTLDAKWSSLSWKCDHGVGIDTGKAMIVRGGVRGDNDLVSVGSAPNIAAKLSGVRTSGKRVLISAAVYRLLHESAKLGGKAKTDMWTQLGTTSFGGKAVTYYGSNWRWSP